MYMIYGALKLDVIDGPEEFIEEYTNDYVEHPVTRGKPKVQIVGAALDRVTIEIVAHNDTSDVAAIYNGIRLMAKSQAVAPFLFASGEYLGTFFVETLSITRKQTDAKGRLIAIEASISLAEASLLSGGIFGLIGAVLSAPGIIARAIINPDSKGGK